MRLGGKEICAYYEMATPTIAKIWLGAAYWTIILMSLRSHHTLIQECLGLVKVLKLLEGPGNRNDHYAVRASKKSDGHL